jgi:hypothetical protein
MNEQIEGVPEGWRLVRIGLPKKGEWFMDEDTGRTSVALFDWSRGIRVILEKIQQPKQYRPFANAAEFAPHRDRWWRFKGESDELFRTYYYSDKSHMWHDWHQSFDKKVFDDGTPFGVEVTE